MTVLKADAYGHGMVPVARFLAEQGQRLFAVAVLEEALTLRRAGIRGRILVLGPPEPRELEAYAAQRIELTVPSLVHLRWVVQHPDAAGLELHLKCDTGMGATLNTASAMQGYALADRGTWLSFRNRAGMRVLVEGDRRLFNPYGVILVNPKRHPHVKADLGRAFIAWLISPEGQAAIGAFRINGEVLSKPTLSGGGHYPDAPLAWRPPKVINKFAGKPRQIRTRG